MPYLSLKKLMVDKFNSSGGHGYFDTQCSIANLAFFFFKKSTTLSISSSVDMPVEMIIGFFVEAIKSKQQNLKCLRNPPSIIQLRAHSISLRLPCSSESKKRLCQV